jgi:hypothetical protein
MRNARRWGALNTRHRTLVASNGISAAPPRFVKFDKLDPVTVLLLGAIAVIVLLLLLT